MSLDLWQRGCQRLATELPEQQFNTWIRPLPAAEPRPADPGTTRLELRVPNRFKLDWIRAQYAAHIESILSELAGHPVKLDLTLAPRDGQGAAVPSAASRPASAALPPPTNGSAHPAPPNGSD